MEDAWVDLRKAGSATCRGIAAGWGLPTLVGHAGRAVGSGRYVRGEFRQDFIKYCEDQLELGVADRHDPARPTRRGGSSRNRSGSWARSSRANGPTSRRWRTSSDAEQNWPGWIDRQPISMIVQAPPDDGPVAETPAKDRLRDRLSPGGSPTGTRHGEPPGDSNSSPGFADPIEGWGSPADPP